LNSEANQSKVDDDLTNRLDSLFDEKDTANQSGTSKGNADDPLDELRSLVMSIEWEITDDVMERFLSQIDMVKTRFEDDRILLMFLQLLGSLGLYVKTNKAKAHPNAFRLLNSVYNSFEKAASPVKISPSEKKKLLYIELNQYKELKEQIESIREPGKTPSHPGDISHGQAGADKADKKARPAMETDADSRVEPRGNAALTRRHFDKAIEELKSSILKELKALRDDVARLAKSR
jgi:hypothetical protein